MHTFILITHIVTMSLSLILLTLISIVAISGGKLKRNNIAFYKATTSAGILSGTLLLLYSPIKLSCLALLVYILMYVFALRFIRDKQAKQTADYQSI